MKAILVIALLAVAMAGDNLTITTNCTYCDGNGTKQCFYLDGGPFNKFEIPVANTSYSSCNGPSFFHFPDNATFSCGSDHNCTNNTCFLQLYQYNSKQCSNYGSAQITAINVLNLFYSYSIGDPTLDSTYNWCENLCGPGLPLWVIIVIAVAAVIVIVGIAVGIWWWRKKGGKLPTLNSDGTEKLMQ